MQKSQLRANLYGIGQLITQRKLFSVPEHQRSFSWAKDQVKDFLTDIKQAIERDSSDYFIGLIVMQGISNSSWVILDGQQRLATATMLYSAMRDWLRLNGFPDDAEQLEKEFIGVRQLGGKYTSRLRLNSENRDFFDKWIVEAVATEELEAINRDLVRGSSNWLLLDAALFCREWVRNYTATQPSLKAQAQKLFRLSAFLEASVNVIGVDVGTDDDAYILFESLNDRGLNLTSLDLVKNFVFSYSNKENSTYFNELWTTIAKNIEGKDPDDFLKVFWTSRFGLVQKSDLFAKIKETFNSPVLATTLIRDLADSSEMFNAIGDPEHLLWQEFGPEARDCLFQLASLGSKQIRPVILGALTRFERGEFIKLLRLLIVVILRFQVIGRGRTGILESNLGRLAMAIWIGNARTTNECIPQIRDIIPDDQTFEAAFGKHIGINGSRLAYILAQLEITNARINQIVSNEIEVHNWRFLLQFASPYRVSSKPTDFSDDVLAAHFDSIGNFVLLEDKLGSGQVIGRGVDLSNSTEILANSRFELTRTVAPVQPWDIEAIKKRSLQLAHLAVLCWNLNNFGN